MILLITPYPLMASATPSVGRSCAEADATKNTRVATSFIMAAFSLDTIKVNEFGRESYYERDYRWGDLSCEGIRSMNLYQLSLRQSRNLKRSMHRTAPMCSQASSSRGCCENKH